MKRCLILVLAIFFLPVYSAFSEQSSRITLIQEFPKTAQESVDIKPFKPEGLSEADKAIIDTDNRITITNPMEYPFSAIAYMDVTCSCEHGGWFGTGFLVSNDLLVSAGHCLFCPSCQKPAEEIVLYFGYLNERNYLACFKETDWHAWIISTPVLHGEHYKMDDYGFIRLSENVGKTTGYLGIRYDVPDSELSKGSFHVTGYFDGLLKHDAERVQPINEKYLKHFADTVSGNSGCPVYDDNNNVIAINTASKKDASENYAVRFTSEIYSLVTSIESEQALNEE